MIIVTVANQKGGVGKTTTAVTLAHGLALKNYRVLLVDLDPQGQCASHLGLDQEDGVFNLLVNAPPMRDVVRTTGRSGLWLLPGSKKTKTAETLMVIERRGVDTIHALLDEWVNGDRLHYVILDTAPSTGGLQENALYTADLLLVPSAVDHLSLEGVAEILKTLKVLGRPSSPAVRILPTFYDEVTLESKANLSRLWQAFGTVLFEPVHRAAALRECPPVGKTIFEHDPESRAAQEYAAVVWGVTDATR
jgi:chromosome partitioning protein